MSELNRCLPASRDGATMPGLYEDLTLKLGGN
jgi:hypothetical protein